MMSLYCFQAKVQMKAFLQRSSKKIGKHWGMDGHGAKAFQHADLFQMKHTVQHD